MKTGKQTYLSAMGALLLVFLSSHAHATEEPVLSGENTGGVNASPENADDNSSGESASDKPKSAATIDPGTKSVRPTIFGRPLKRQGFHFQATLGLGVGPEVDGLYHTMELGWSFSGYSVSLLHTFLQNKGFFGNARGGPDEIGGFMLQLTGPIYFDDLTWKFASGVGGTVDQPDGEFNANPGFGVHYGVDLHYPIWPKFGPTLSLGAMNVVSEGEHHFGAGLALGITVF